MDIVDHPHGKRQAELATPRLVEKTAAQSRLQYVQFRLAHGPLEAQQQPVVEMDEIVNAVFVKDERAPGATPPAPSRSPPCPCPLSLTQDSPAQLSRSVTDPDGAVSEKLENFSMKGKYGAGLEASVVNLGIGPSAEYWFTDNIVASGHLGLGTFTTYGIRGDYVFSKPLKLYRTYAAEPYVGLGYTFIKGPEESFAGGSVKTDGSGVDLHAGLFMPAQYIYKNVALGAEVAYSTATVEATATVGSTKTTVSGDYSSFGLGLGIYYFFN